MLCAGIMASTEAYAQMANDAPVISDIPDQNITAGQAFTYAVSASDADNDALVYSLGSSPSGATIDATTGVITWQTDSSDVAGSPYAFVVNVYDGTESDSMSFIVTVYAQIYPLMRTVEINDYTAKGPALNDRDKFGSSVASLGDLDGDGIHDIAVGAQMDDGGSGAIHIMYMSANGAPKKTAVIDGATPNGPALDHNDHFGVSVASLGDLDNDGVSDIAVGAKVADDGYGPYEGSLYIIYMRADGTIKSTVEINDTTTNGPVLSALGGFGASVASLGDLDNDGISEIAVGESRGGDGALHIMYMGADGTIKSTVEVNGTTTNGPALSALGGFGASVASLGDLDGDGISEIAVGESRGGGNTGALHIMYMGADGTIKSTVEVNGTTTNGPALSALGGFGASVASLGDLDGDGISEIAVGESRGGGNTGALHIIYMGADGTIKSTVEVNGTTTNGPTLDNLDKFGVSAASLGDLDGDGIPDIAVGASGDDANGDRKGTIHIMLTKDRAPATSAPRITAGFTSAQSSSSQSPSDSSNPQPPDEPNPQPPNEYPPVFIGLNTGAVVTAGNLFTDTFCAEDPDGDAVRVTLYEHPSGVDIRDSVGICGYGYLVKEIIWQTDADDVGTHTFTLKATDGMHQTTQPYTITVVPGNENVAAPYMSPILPIGIYDLLIIKM